MVALCVLQPIADVNGGNYGVYGMVKGPLHDVSCKPYLTVMATSPDPQFLIGYQRNFLRRFCKAMSGFAKLLSPKGKLWIVALLVGSLINL